jgi:hypothetical protein
MWAIKTNGEDDVDSWSESPDWWGGWNHAVFLVVLLPLFAMKMAPFLAKIYSVKVMPLIHLDVVIKVRSLSRGNLTTSTAF